jgi:hypothetical protein
MKFSRIYGIGLLATALLVSCNEDLLNEEPPLEIIIDNAIKNENDLKTAVNGMYEEFSGADSFGVDIIAFGDLISDNVFVSQTNDGYYLTTNQMAWNADNAGDFNMLDELYDAVALANMSINEGSKLEQTTTVKNLIGEAHVGRALAFFTLLNFYSANPTSGKYQEFGIPIYTGDYNPNGSYPRTTVAESYNQIISDLETGLSLMSFDTPSSKAYFSPTVANFILSKVYLTRGESNDYQLAIEYANKVLNNSPAAYQLIGSGDLVAYFTNSDANITENHTETIWEIDYTAISNPGLNAALGAFYANNGNHRSLMVRRSLYDSYNAGDVRLELFKTNAIPSSDDPTGVWTAKHLRSNSEGNFAQNTKVFRMTEALFVKWEAMAKLGQGAAALTELNAFATARGGNTYSGDALEAVLAEKRKEFVAEGVRFFDLKRNNLGIEKVTNCFGASCSVAPMDRLFVIPMPRGEMNLNPFMTQYPEW